LGSRLEWRIHSNFLTDFQQNVLTLKRFEALGLYPQCISPRRQIRRYVFSSLIGGQSFRDSSRYVGDYHRSSNNVSTGLVGNCPKDLPVAALATDLKTGHQQSEKRKEGASAYQGAHSPKSVHS
jgi:hypothetical protein